MVIFLEPRKDLRIFIFILILLDSYLIDICWKRDWSSVEEKLKAISFKEIGFTGLNSLLNTSSTFMIKSWSK